MTCAAFVVCVLAAAFGGQALRRTGVRALPKRPVDLQADAVGGWWAQDSVHTYLPPLAKSTLSQNISDYYFALGNRSLLSEEHVQSRVGGEGLVHIFHLPNGTSHLRGHHDEKATPKKKGFELSELFRMTAGTKLASFPEYPLPDDYEDPLDSSALALEERVMSTLTEALYRGYLQELANESSATLKVSSRNTDDKAATGEVVDYLQREFESMGATTCVHFFRSGSRDIYNVIGLVRGTLSGSVTIGAHFDSIPSRGAALGAEDDGSGTAAVLAAAKAFASAGVTPKKSIYFVGFGGEEQGLIGSKRFADELKNPGSSSSPIPEACRVSTSSDHSGFTMDMIGWRNPSFSTDTITMETFEWSKALLNPLALSNEVNNGGALKLLYSDYPFGSDHMSFLNNNFLATLTIDNDADVYKYSCYHRSCDTIEKINYGFACKSARMNLGAAMRVAGIAGETVPTPPPPPTPVPTPAPTPTNGNWEVLGSGCVMDGNCVSSLNHPSDYGNNQECSVTLYGNVAVTVEAFSTESSYDILTVGGNSYSGSSGPPSGTYSGSISWVSDGSVTNSGWKMCRT